MATIEAHAEIRRSAGGGAKLSETRRQFLQSSGRFLASATILAASSGRSYAASYSWTRVSGTAKDIGAGGGRIWIIGNTPNDSAGYDVYMLTDEIGAGNPWMKMGGVGTRIDVDGDGRAWVVDAHGNIYRAKGTGPSDNFSRVNGSAKDVGAGGGKVWVIGNTPVNSRGYHVYLLTDDPNGRDPWTKMGRITGTRIAVDGDGTAWVVNSQGIIYHWTVTGRNADFSQVPGAAKDVGAGGGRVWVIGNTPDNNFGFDLYLFAPSLGDTTPWALLPGAGTDITVDDSGNPWVVNAQNDIFHAEIDPRLRCFNIIGCHERGRNIPSKAPNILCSCQ